MTDKKELQKQYNKIVEEQINNADETGDMYPIMEAIYHWGYRNITPKELKKIIERNKNE